jgi:hypothetical protein
VGTAGQGNVLPQPCGQAEQHRRPDLLPARLVIHCHGTARSSYRRLRPSLSIDEKFSAAYNNRADVYIEMGQPGRAMPDLAIKDVESAVKLAVDRDLLEENLAEFKERAG